MSSNALAARRRACDPSTCGAEDDAREQMHPNTGGYLGAAAGSSYVTAGGAERTASFQVADAVGDSRRSPM